MIANIEDVGTQLKPVRRHEVERCSDVCEELAVIQFADSDVLLRQI